MLIDHTYKLYRWYQLISTQTPMEDCELQSRCHAWTLDSSFVNHLKNLSSLPERFLPSPENEWSYSTVFCIQAILLSQAIMGSSRHLLVKTHVGIPAMTTMSRNTQINSDNTDTFWNSHRILGFKAEVRLCQVSEENFLWSSW